MSSSSTVASAGGLPDDVVNLLRKGSACTQEELTGLEEKLISLKVDTLRALSQCFGVKRSSGAKKAVLIGRLLSYCELGILKDVTEEGERAGGEDDGNAYGNTRQATAEEKTVLKTLPDFKTVTTGWTKDLTALQKLSFVDIFTYLVESRESTFDKEKMEAYKSLKGVKYMEDGLVRIRNVWSKSIEPGYQVIFIKAHIHASWTDHHCHH